MYHSLIISGKNTWDEWHLVPTSRPIVNPPKVRTQYIDLPGGNGFIDLTELLTGGPTYGSRTGSWAFIAHPDYHRTEPWNVKYQDILAYVHGKAHQIILEDDPAYYYEGRLSVNQWQSGQNWSQVQIDYELQPFKKEVISSIEPWLWDPFNFETGIIRDYRNLAVNGTLVLEVPGSSRPYAPTFQVTAAMTVTTSGGTEYELLAGENTFGSLMIGPAGETLTFSGSGTVSVVYQGAWL